MPDNNNHTTNAINGHTLQVTDPPSPFEIRSGEVQEIMTRMPHWIIRQGTTVLLTVMLILFGAAYCIRFPDVVTTHVRVVSSKPDEKILFVVNASLPVDLAAKVKPGNRAFIKLSRYPFQDFGMIEAVVDAVIIGERDTAYTVQLRLVNGLVTTLDKRIPPEPQLFGAAEILTDEKTVFERLVAVK